MPPPAAFAVVLLAGAAGSLYVGLIGWAVGKVLRMACGAGHEATIKRGLSPVLFNQWEGENKS